MDYERMTKAELIAALKALQSSRPTEQSTDELQRKLHELQVHQIELEMQNRALLEAQQELEASRNAYADLYDFSPAGYLTLNDKGAIEAINLTGATMLGVVRSQLIGQPFFLYVAESDVERFWSHLRQCRQTDEKVTTELSLRLIDGESKVLELSSVAVHDAAENVTQHRTVLVDITTHRQAEEARQESEARMHAIVNTAADGIITINERGVIEFFNPVAEKMFGYTAEEVIGQNIRILMPESYQREHEDYITRYMRTGDKKVIGTRREVVGRRKDGTTFPMELSVGEVSWAHQKLFTGIVRDITKRKAAEEELHYQKILFEAPSEADIDGILVVDSDRKWVFFNQRFIEMWDIPEDIAEKQSSEAALRWVVDKLVNPQQYRESTLYLYEHPDEECQDEVPLKNGRTFDRYSAPVRGQDGLYYGRIWFYRNITEQKQVERELQTRVQQQTIVSQLGQFALGEVDLATLMDKVVHRIAQTLDVELCKVLQLLPDGDALLLEAGVGWKEGLIGYATVSANKGSQAGYTLLSNEPVIVDDLRTETRFSGPPLLSDHGVISGLSVMIPTPDPPYGVLGAHTTRRRTFTKDDVYFIQAVANILAMAIERKHAAETLQKSEERFRTLSAASPVGIFQTDAKGNGTYINARNCEITGLSPEESLGQGWMSALHPDDRKRVLAAWSQTTRSGEEFGIEYRFKTPQGKVNWVFGRAIALQNDAGEPRGYIGTLTDITALKQAEEREKSHQRQLLQADRMASLGVLVSGVAHEINNPNYYITLNAKLVKRAWDEVVPILEQYYQENGEFDLAGIPYVEAHERIGQLIEGTSQGAMCIQKIVESLKNFARQDTGDLNQQVDVNSVVKSATLILGNLIKKSTRHFSVALGENLPTVQGNPQQLEQVLINLITNSCQALESRKEGIVVSTAYDGARNHLILTVRDEGEGITPENLRHIMDPFFTTKPHQGGTGLGLSVSYGIVKAHGGELDFVSAPGKRTTATITLPVDR